MLTMWWFAQRVNKATPSIAIETFVGHFGDHRTPFRALAFLAKDVRPN
jgi:hypothetical protein